MKKKKQELKPDIVLKNYWSDNSQFADLFNAVLFNGEQAIRSEELEDVDTEESSVLEHREYAESMQAARDNIKIHKRSALYGAEFVLLGLESQEHVHYAMPMRIMGYDYGSYKKQYSSNSKRYRTAEGLDEDEYISRMKRTDRFLPVITVVVYYGENPWDGAKSLHGMLQIPEGLAQYVNDYKMLLVEARQNDLKFHNLNNRDLFSLLQIVLDRSVTRNEAKEKAIQYSEDHKTESSVIMTVAGATNSKINYGIFEKGDVNMCTLFEEIAKESEVKGKAEGIVQGIVQGKAEGIVQGKAEGIVQGKAEGIIETGYEFGLTDAEILVRLQNKLRIPAKKSKEFLENFKK